MKKGIKVTIFLVLLVTSLVFHSVAEHRMAPDGGDGWGLVFGLSMWVGLSSLIGLIASALSGLDIGGGLELMFFPGMVMRKTLREIEQAEREHDDKLRAQNYSMLDP